MTQYIGARYVPLLTGDWNPNQVYEPLSVVAYLRSTYTSKTTVPAGTLPTNTDYWMLSGNYAGDFADLQEQITENANAINSLEDKAEIFTAQIATNSQDIGNLKDTVAEHTGSIQKNSSDISVINSDISVIKSDINDIEDKNTEQDMGISENRQDITALQAGQSEHASAISNLQTATQQLHTTVNAHTASISQINQNISSLEAAQQETASDLTEIQENFQNIQEEISEVQDDLSKYPIAFVNNQYLYQYIPIEKVLVANAGIENDGWITAWNNYAYKDKVSQIYFIGGDNDQNPSITALNRFLAGFTVEWCYIWTADVWHNPPVRDTMIRTINEIERNLPTNGKFFNTMGWIHAGDFYTNGVINSVGYQIMEGGIRNILKGSDNWNQQYNQGTNPYMQRLYIDNHIAIFNNIYITFQSASWAINTQTQLEGDDYILLNPTLYYMTVLALWESGNEKGYGIAAFASGEFFFTPLTPIEPGERVLHVIIPNWTESMHYL